MSTMTTGCTTWASAQRAVGRQREQRARARKSTAIAAFLSAQGVTAAEAEQLDIQGQRAAALLAGQRVASERTWALVVQKMRRQ